VPEESVKADRDLKPAIRVEPDHLEECSEADVIFRFTLDELKRFRQLLDAAIRMSDTEIAKFSKQNGGAAARGEDV
jgi:hypothetical protein